MLYLLSRISTALIFLLFQQLVVPKSTNPQLKTELELELSRALDPPVLPLSSTGISPSPSTLYIQNSNGSFLPSSSFSSNQILSSPLVSFLQAQAFPMLATTVWAIVMWIFRYHPHSLQPSLQASMNYLYLDSQKWTSLRNWIWHNK